LGTSSDGIGSLTFTHHTGIKQNVIYFTFKAEWTATEQGTITVR